MSSYVFQTGATSKTITVRAYVDTTFLPKSDLVFNTAGLTAYYRAGATGTATAITLATQTVGGAWATGGFVATDATNMPGEYRLDLPDAVLSGAAGTLVSVVLKGTNVVFQPIDILLTADDPAAAAATTTEIATAVWASATRTLSSFGTLIADIWANATRTLSAFGFTPTPSNAADTTAIKAKTDSLTFTTAGIVDANAKQINDGTVYGAGVSGNNWRGTA